MSAHDQPPGDGPRLPAVSRRAVLVGGSAAAAAPAGGAAALQLPVGAAPADPTKPYRALLHLDARISRLRRRWARLEAYRDGQPRQPGTAPAGLRELRDIDGMLELLLEQRAALLEKLPTRGATTLEEVIARLAVAEQLIWTDDHLEAQTMIAGSRQDLIAWLGAPRPRAR
ncbi:MAG: helicase [Phenylobacterium sp.]|uniref:helicase n=1 Tax=Phenylobacterium sp. TaxID=1871053 RepID=UPI001A2A9D3D|nr:helicase [Phenylobacterium sp.]MBJ7411257.1 helicase [Phenylobacterium sp.]